MGVPSGYTSGQVVQAVPTGINSGFVLVATATPTAVASVSINNCFTSTYENYRIIFSATAMSGAGDLTFRLRASGTDTTTNYTYQLFESYSATYASTVNAVGTDEFYVSRMDTPVGTSSSIDIYRPQVAARTSYTAISVFQTTTPILVQQHVAGMQTASTQFDGFTMLTAGTSFTGTIRVYGYSNS